MSEVMTIAEEQLSEWSAEASDLGLRPGEWPNIIEVTMRDGTTARSRRHRVLGPARDPLGYVYQGDDGRTLTLWND